MPSSWSWSAASFHCYPISAVYLPCCPSRPRHSCKVRASLPVCPTEHLPPWSSWSISLLRRSSIRRGAQDHRRCGPSANLRHHRVPAQEDRTARSLSGSATHDRDSQDLEIHNIEWRISGLTEWNCREIDSVDLKSHLSELGPQSGDRRPFIPGCHPISPMSVQPSQGCPV